MNVPASNPQERFLSDKGNGFARNKARFRTPGGCDGEIRIHPASLFPSQSPPRGGKGVQTPPGVPKGAGLRGAFHYQPWLPVASGSGWYQQAQFMQKLCLKLRGEEGEVPHMLRCSAPFFPSSPLGISYQAAFYLTLAGLQMHSAHRERRGIRERTLRKPSSWTLQP